MTSSLRIKDPVLRGYIFLLSTVVLFFLAGCGDNATGNKAEYAYISSPDAVLRDRIATIYNKTGVLHNGERVQVLERLVNRRFVKVRSSRGEEGWIQERFLTNQLTFDQLQRLAEQFKNLPAQAIAVARAQSNLHAIPGRKTEHLYQLNENDKVEVLQRETVDRNAPGTPMKSVDKDQKDSEADSGSDEPSNEKPNQTPVWEDWWLIRDSQKHVGWVLGRLLYVDVPIEIAQYAEGQRIVAFFILDEPLDGDKKVPEYLVLMSESKDGLPYDFDNIRVFTWNVRRHRYETAYREHNLAGFLPAKVGSEDFGGKEGTLRTFTLRLKDQDGNLHEQKYKFNPPIVRLVLSPGEQAAKVHRRTPSRIKRRRSR
ncbi:MAG TPA: SH3 domain-containing protein [Candidatus Angelobacter sp.]|jgi:SH3-like domain-containing protein|nr:SH3 domain-containing protein [Candidatus Angelobacter sp.]